jgi:hypothetical protein
VFRSPCEDLEVAFNSGLPDDDNHHEGAGDAFGHATVQCPWCFESVELGFEADVEGTLVQDCEVCCRPCSITVGRDEDGGLTVEVDRA